MLGFSVHKILAHAPGAANRDDANQQKTITVGGVERTRNGSYYIARFIREYTRSKLFNAKKDQMWDTSHTPREVMNRMPRRPKREVGIMLSVVLADSSLYKGTNKDTSGAWWRDPANMRCNQGNRMTSNEFQEIANFLERKYDEILGSDEYSKRAAYVESKLAAEQAAEKSKAEAKEKYKKMTAEEKKAARAADKEAKAEEKKRQREEKKAASKDNQFSKELRKILKSVPVSHDLAVWGRFLADVNQLTETIVSAVTTGNAFSTSESKPEPDNWTRADDFREKFHLQGSSGMGTRYLSSQVMLYFGTCDVEAVMQNLALHGMTGDLRAMAVEAILLFVEAWAHAMPRIGRASSADFPLPSFFNLSMFKDSPVATFPVAFFKPVSYMGETYRGDPVADSIRQYHDVKSRYVSKWESNIVFDKWLSVEDESSDSRTHGASANISSLMNDFREALEAEVQKIDVSKYEGASR